MSATEGLHCFLTGTDTAVGKTTVAAWMVSCWRRQGLDAAGLKPITCGGMEDARHLRAAGGKVLSLEEISPVRYRLPVAPAVAAQTEGNRFQAATVRAGVRRQQRRFSHLVVEGVGGWLVPVTPRWTVREWAGHLGLPVVIVARAGLGTINHTLLTVESVRASGLPCLGIVMNFYRIPPGPASRSNAAVLEEWTGLPVFSFTTEAQRGGELPEWLGGARG